LAKSALIETVAALLGPKGTDPGILHRHGRVLMSSWESVRASPYYALGINPGGETLNPAPASETIAASLTEDRSEGWNYFTDDSSKQGHREKLAVVFEALGALPARTPCSNMLFLRSSNADDQLPADADEVWRKYCAPVHAELMRIIQPKVVVCFGRNAWNLLTKPCDPGHWNFHPSVSLSIGGFDHTCGVLLLPHFSPRANGAWTRNPAVLLKAMHDARALAEEGGTAV
jgi:uracil-DNA glycosylase